MTLLIFLAPLLFVIGHLTENANMDSTSTKVGTFLRILGLIMTGIIVLIIGIGIVFDLLEL